jgi:hypothetical protein
MGTDLFSTGFSRALAVGKTDAPFVWTSQLDSAQAKAYATQVPKH